MIYELLIRRAASSRLIWKAGLREPFMAFSAGQLIAQPGGGPFKIEKVLHTFDMTDAKEPIHRITLMVSGEE